MAYKAFAGKGHVLLLTVQLAEESHMTKPGLYGRQ